MRICFWDSKTRPHLNRKDKKQVNQHTFQLLIWTFWSWTWTWPHHHHHHLHETEVKRIIFVLNDCLVHNHHCTGNVYCVQASIEFHLMHSNKFSRRDDAAAQELQLTLVTIINSTQPARFISIVIPSSPLEQSRAEQSGSVNKLLLLPQLI